MIDNKDIKERALHMCRELTVYGLQHILSNYPNDATIEKIEKVKDGFDIYIRSPLGIYVQGVSYDLENMLEGIKDRIKDRMKRESQMKKERQEETRKTLSVITNEDAQ